MSSKRIMFDIDGVLAEFLSPFTHLARGMFPTALEKVISHVEQESWDSVAAFGINSKLTRREQGAVWDRLKADKNFWRNLPTMVTYPTWQRIRALHLDYPVYFVTSRVGVEAWEQTRDWLIMQGITFPSVVITSYKGEFAHAARITHSIEDKAENAWCIHWLSPNTKSYLIKRKYISSAKVHLLDHCWF